MPLYEFVCGSCGQQFEALVRRSGAPVCPRCSSSDLQRVPSLFAVDSPTTRRAALESGRRRNTKTARDKQVAEHEERHHHHD